MGQGSFLRLCDTLSGSLYLLPLYYIVFCVGRGGGSWCGACGWGAGGDVVVVVHECGWLRRGWGGMWWGVAVSGEWMEKGGVSR